MRRVACYAVSSKLTDDERNLDAIESVSSAVELWLKAKGLKTIPERSAAFEMTSGRAAKVHLESATFNADHARDVSVDEETDTGRFYTRICFGTRAGELLLFVELRAGGDPLKVRPVPITAHCPQVFRDILDMREWFVGDTLVRTKPITFHGQQGALKLMGVIRHQDRNLPVIAVSEKDGVSLTPSLAQDLARDLSGLAIVAHLDDASSWTLSEEFGREWSCFNGAVRMYWPLRRTAISAFDHPLWTMDRLLSNAVDSQDAGQRLRRQLRRQLLAISTYTVVEPQALMAIFTDVAQQRLQTLRESADSLEEWRQLAEEYAQDNKDLSARLKKLQRDADGLLAQNEQLLISLCHIPELDDTASIPPEPEPVVDTAKEAVLAAMQRFPDELVVGSDVFEGLQTIAADAGPPDKVFEYLRTLAEMTRQRQCNGLGKDIIIWLRDHNVRASGESETTLKSDTAMGCRTWDAGGGTKRRFTKHLKPSEGTSPDRCVRIYFDYDETACKTIIGWVGRHPGT